MAIAESTDRLSALRKLLLQGELGTQDELRSELERMEFEVTQSTISRDLRKIGAVKAIDPDGRTVYRLPEEASVPMRARSLQALVLDMNSNGPLIVIHTTPGSASLVARHLDLARPGGILGTIAGDDTVFVAVSKPARSKSTLTAIQASLSGT